MTKRLSLLALLLVLLSQSVWASLPRTDSFTYSNGNLATVSGGTWTDIKANPVTVVSNALSEGASADAAAIDNQNTYSNDQYAKAVISGDYPGVCVRMVTTSGGNGYVMYKAASGAGNLKVDKYTNGTRSAVFASTGGAANGDTVELRAVGTTISIYINGTLDSSVTDSSFSSGSAGVFIQQSGNASVDNWEGGNVGGAAAQSGTKSLRGFGK